MSGLNTKLGLIGLGRMGRLHLDKFSRLRGVHIVGFFDPSHQLPIETPHGQKVPSFHDLRPLLFETDAVVIASPTHTHFDIANIALRSGNHVLVEKPPTQRRAELEELIQLAEMNQLLLSVGFVERHRFRSLTETLSLGKLKHFEAERLCVKPGRERTVDVAMDLLIHDLDILFHLMPKPFFSCVGYHEEVLGFGPDRLSCFLEFPDDTTAFLRTSRTEIESRRQIRLYTEKATAWLDMVGDLIHVSWKHSLQTEIIPNPDPDPLLTQAKNFIDAVQGTSPLFVHAQEALRVFQAINEILSVSTRSQRFVERESRTLPFRDTSWT